jgi:hypothetical protein
MSLRSRAESASARALPPLRPPSRPSAAAWGFLRGSDLRMPIRVARSGPFRPFALAIFHTIPTVVQCDAKQCVTHVHNVTVPARMLERSRRSCATIQCPSVPACKCRAPRNLTSSPRAQLFSACPTTFQSAKPSERHRVRVFSMSHAGRQRNATAMQNSPIKSGVFAISPLAATATAVLDRVRSS